MKAANIAGTIAAVFVVAVMLAAGGKPQPAPAPEPQLDVVTAQRSAVACSSPDQLARAKADGRDCVQLVKGERYVVTAWGIDAVKLRPEQGFFEYWAPRGAVE